jgi:hypothetical protein
VSSDVAVRSIRVALVGAVLAGTAALVRPEVAGGTAFVAVAIALAAIAGVGSAWSP